MNEKFARTKQKIDDIFEKFANKVKKNGGRSSIRGQFEEFSRDPNPRQ